MGRMTEQDGSWGFSLNNDLPELMKNWVMENQGQEESGPVTGVQGGASGEY